MGELTEQWAAEGKTNVFGNVMSVTEMEGEMGVAGENCAAGGWCLLQLFGEPRGGIQPQGVAGCIPLEE